MATICIYEESINYAITISPAIIEQFPSPLCILSVKEGQPPKLTMEAFNLAFQKEVYRNISIGTSLSYEIPKANDFWGPYAQFVLNECETVVIKNHITFVSGSFFAVVFVFPVKYRNQKCVGLAYLKSVNFLKPKTIKSGIEVFLPLLELGMVKAIYPNLPVEKGISLIIQEKCLE